VLYITLFSLPNADIMDYIMSYCALCSAVNGTQNADNSYIHRVSKKNFAPLACYSFDASEWILIFFLAEMYPIKWAITRRFTMPPQITCASALPGKMGKHGNHIFHSIGLCYTHNAHVRCLPERKKNAICDAFDSA